MQGKIKVLMGGYGFITSSETEKDTFFHAASLEGVAFDDLKVGDTLSFEIGEGNNGKQQAMNVTLVPEGEEEVEAQESEEEGH